MKASIITDQIDQDLETALKVASEQGYENVELHNVFGKTIEQCNYFETESISKLLKKYNMQVSCIASTVFFLCPLYEDDKVSLFNEEFHAITGGPEAHLKCLRNACRIARRLDCPRIRVFPFRFPDNKKPPFGTQQEIKDILRYMRKALAIAKEYDVTLVLENCPYSRLPKGMMSIQIVKAIDDPHMRLLWDPANSFRAYKENVPEEYLTFSLSDELSYIYSYINHIHIKDYYYDPAYEKEFQHVALLQGDIEYENIFSYLRKKKYLNYVSLEPEVPYDDVITSMEVLKKILSL